MDLRFDGGIAPPTTEPNFDQQAFTPSVALASDGTVTVTYSTSATTPQPGDAGYGLLRRAL
jgi:hypothetical protein